MQDENEITPTEQLLGTEDGKRSYTLFQGHAGPIYSATFSPLGDFILSSSSDSTGTFLFIYAILVILLCIFGSIKNNFSYFAKELGYISLLQFDYGARS